MLEHYTEQQKKRLDFYTNTEIHVILYSLYIKQ